MVIRRFLLVFVGMLLAVGAFSQKVRTVSGTYTYVVPENLDLERAKLIALERVKIQLIANEFGTTISQSNVTSVKNSQSSSVDFISIGQSEVRGEWIETIGEPTIKTEVDNNQLVVKVWLKGRIREMVAAEVDFAAHVLRNGTDDKFESTDFRDGDDLYLSFLSPVSGYVAVYLIDNDGQAFCLLPYSNQEQGMVKVKANQRYLFFSSQLATSDLQSFVDEYTMTCTRTQELNQIYVIFSPNAFTKAVDSRDALTLPRALSQKDFQQWLSKCRTKDKQMTLKRIDIVVKK